MARSQLQVNDIHVIKIELNDRNLVGKIPAELGNLSSLEYLSLSSNKLIGTIPAELGSLCCLQDLHLYRNLLTGTVPAELGNLSSLEYLSLSSIDSYSSDHSPVAISFYYFKNKLDVTPKSIVRHSMEMPNAVNPLALPVDGQTNTA